MRALAIILLVGVLMAFWSDRFLDGVGGFSRAAWWYMLAGAWQFLLAAMLAVWVWGSPPSIWRRLALAAMGIALVESALVPLCRLGVGPSLAAVPRGTNMCDAATGLPVSAVVLSLEFLIFCACMGAPLGAKKK